MLSATLGTKLVLRGLRPHTESYVKNVLTIRNPKFDAAVRFSGLPPHVIRNIPKTILMYVSRNGTFEIPRGFDLKKYFDDKELACLSNGIVDERVEATASGYPKLLIEPRKEQQDLLEKFKTHLKSKDAALRMGCYLVVMEVSSGKTIGAALMARYLQQRTLILVHTRLIMNTWIADLCKMYGEDYRKDIGIIQGSKATVGPHYTIAMGQTWFRRKDKWEDWWKEFGVMIYDESNTSPACTFHECANNCPCKYRIGLTGTPTRKDGLQSMMYLVFGTAFYKSSSDGQETENSLPVKDVNIVYTDTKLPETYNDKQLDSNRDYLEIMSILTDDEERLMLAASVVKSLLDEDKRNSVLVSTHRVKHARRLKKAIKALYSGKVALLIGAKSKSSIDSLAEKLKARKIRCTVATMQLVKMGTSIPPWNRLVITTPIGNVQELEQLVGRIRRKCSDKSDAKITHLVDRHVPFCYRHYIKRALPFYRDKLHIERFQNVFSG